MKQIFKSLSLCCLAICLLLGGFLVYQNTGIVYGAETNSNTYTYNANIVENYDTTFLNGISSVESVSFDYCNYYYFTCVNLTLDFSVVTSGNLAYSAGTHYKYVGLRLDRYNIVNYTADCFTSSIMLFGDFVCNNTGLTVNNGCKLYAFSGSCSGILVTDYNLNPYNQNTVFPYATTEWFYSSRSYLNNDSNLSQFLDFDSSTNYEFSTLDDSCHTGYNGSVGVSFFSFINCINSNNSATFSTGYLRHPINSCLLPFEFFVFQNNDNVLWTKVECDYFLFNCTFRATRLGLARAISTTRVVYINDFTVIVNRPVERLENALVLYNYDYDCAIKNINHIEYALSKDTDKYIAKYDGSLPNTRYIGIVSEDLQNRVYDEYIYIYFTFNNNVVDLSKSGKFSLGFDFNFSKYYEPFVIETINTGGYDLPILNKPRDWWDFGGWIMYAFVFVLFYNPVVSTFCPYLTHFIALIYNSLTFITGFSIGTVLTGLLGFSILLGFFSSFVPSKSVPKLFDRVSNSTTNVIVKGADNYKQSSIEKAKHNEYKRKLKEHHSINHLDK